MNSGSNHVEKRKNYWKQVWYVYLHSHFEDAEEAEGTEDREAERAGLRLEMGPDHLKNTAADHQTVEPESN